MKILKANKIYLTKIKTSSLRLKNSFLQVTFKTQHECYGIFYIFTINKSINTVIDKL